MNFRYFKNLRYDLLMYIANNITTNIPSQKIRKIFYKKIMKFNISHTTNIFIGCTFYAKGGLHCGNNVVINSNTSLDTRGGIHIGNNVSISQRCTVLTTDHDPNSPSFATRSNSVNISDNCFIGTSAILLPGAKMNEGAILAAGSILTAEIPTNEIWAGSPARKIGHRNPQKSYTVKYERYFH